MNLITMITWKNATIFLYHMVFVELLETNMWVGVKIPRPGYLDPHPYLQAKHVKKIFFIQTNWINFITMKTGNIETVFDSIGYLLSF